MKVFIVSDMEGVAGIVRWQQVTGGHAMYEEGRADAWWTAWHQFYF